MKPPQQLRQTGTGRAAAQHAADAIASGRAEEARGRLPTAMAHYRSALAAAPRDPTASLLLGNLLVRAGQPQLAIPILKDAVRVPSRAEAVPRHLLGIAYLEARQLDEAKRELAKALQLAPSSADILKSLGNWAMRAQETAAAEDYYRKAISRAPKDIDAKLRLAALLLFLGREVDARAAYREILAAGHALPVVYAGLVEANDPALGAEDYLRVAAIADNPAVSPPERRMLHFAAAKLDKRDGRLDAEFGHYTAGKALLRAFDLGYFTELVDALIATITPDFLAARAVFAQPTGLPIQIFGMPRSGTSLVERILAAHPQVGAAGETFFFEPALTGIGIASGHRGQQASVEESMHRLKSLDANEAAALASQYLTLLKTRGGDSRHVTEKTPHNFLHLWLLALLFPNAIYFHCVRDPVATCFSCFSTDLGEWHSYTRDLDTLGRYFRLYEKLMRHWRTVLPIKIQDCRYEELVRTGEDGIRDLVERAGLPWDAACLGFHETSRVSQTASYTQVREPIHTRRVESWRVYEDQLGPLLEALGES